MQSQEKRQGSSPQIRKKQTDSPVRRSSPAAKNVHQRKVSTVKATRTRTSHAVTTKSSVRTRKASAKTSATSLNKTSPTASRLVTTTPTSVPTTTTSILGKQPVPDRPPPKGEDKQEGVKLKRQLGLINAVTIIIGCVIGAGIFVSPRGVIQQCGSVGASLIIWFVCGLISTIGAFCYAELGTTIPVSGGDYAYIHKVFGDIPAFILLWTSILIIQPVSNAIAALTFANYILVAINPGCAPPQDAVRLISVVLISFLVAVNCYSVKCSSRIQDWFSLAKVIGLIIIIITGIVIIIQGKNNEWLSYPKSFEGTNFTVRHIALAIYSGIFSYNGWQFVNYVVEELIDPFRNLPLAILISLPAITAIYLMTNIAYFSSLSPQEIMDSNAVAVTFGYKNFGRFAWIMPVAVSLCTFSGLNGIIFTASRMWFVGARNGHLPQSMALLNVKYLTPMPSLVVLGFLSCAYLYTTEIYVLINYCMFIQFGSVLASITALIYLRVRSPEMPRPIKIPIIVPCIFYAICLWIVLFPFYATPIGSLIGLCIAFSAIPVYFLTVNWKDKPDLYRRLIDCITINFQKFFYSIPQEDG